MNNRQWILPPLMLLAVCLASVAPLCHANFIFTVTLDTTSLIGDPAGPFSIEFQLNDGSGTNDGNNTALLSDFQFGGGMPVGSATLIGGASGDLGSNIVIADNAFLNEFFQEFAPGTMLSFQVELTTNVDPGPQPDQFSFAILDCTLVEIPTQGPADALVLSDITATPTVQTYAGDPSRASECSGLPVTIALPRIVSEPATILLLGGVLAGLWTARGRRRRPGAERGVNRSA